MQRSEVIEKVNKVLIDGFEINQEQLKPEAHLYHDLGIDSLDAVDMLVFLEEQTGMQVKGEWFKHVRRLEDIYNVMDNVLNGNIPVAAGSEDVTALVASVAPEVSAEN